MLSRGIYHMMVIHQVKFIEEEKQEYIKDSPIRLIILEMNLMIVTILIYLDIKMLIFQKKDYL